jgi:hypothetical protein
MNQTPNLCIVHVSTVVNLISCIHKLLEWHSQECRFYLLKMQHFSILNFLSEKKKFERTHIIWFSMLDSAVLGTAHVRCWALLLVSLSFLQNLEFNSRIFCILKNYDKNIKQYFIPHIISLIEIEIQIAKLQLNDLFCLIRSLSQSDHKKKKGYLSQIPRCLIFSIICDSLIISLILCTITLHLSAPRSGWTAFPMQFNYSRNTNSTYTDIRIHETSMEVHYESFWVLTYTKFPSKFTIFLTFTFFIVEE